jgi:hypothetical protein
MEMMAIRHCFSMLCYSKMLKYLRDGQPIIGPLSLSASIYSQCVIILCVVMLFILRDLST